MKEEIKDSGVINKDSIAWLFEVLRVAECLTYSNIAKPLGTTEEQLKQIKNLKDEEINLEWIFRLYFFAQTQIDNPYREDYIKDSAYKLKEKCYAEIKKRGNVS